MEITIDMTMSNEIGEISKALASAQGEFPAIKKEKRVKVKMKSGGDYVYHYADFASMVEQVRPFLAKYELSVTQPIVGEYIVTTVSHSSGQFFRSFYPLQNPKSMKPQDHGSLQTYARRYSFGAMLCLPTEDDDDGARAQQAVPKKAVLKNHAPVNRTVAAGEDVPTNAQLKKMWAMLGEAGLKEEEKRKDFMRATVGKDSSKDLTKKDIQFLFETIETNFKLGGGYE